MILFIYYFCLKRSQKIILSTVNILNIILHWYGFTSYYVHHFPVVSGVSTSINYTLFNEKMYQQWKNDAIGSYKFILIRIWVLIPINIYLPLLYDESMCVSKHHLSVLVPKIHIYLPSSSIHWEDLYLVLFLRISQYTCLNLFKKYKSIFSLLLLVGVRYANIPDLGHIVVQLKSTITPPP